MALSVSADATTITLSGWVEALSISKTNLSAALSGNDALPVVTVGSKFTIPKSGLCAHVNGSTRTRPSAFTSYSTATGADQFGSYLELTLNVQVKVTDGSAPETMTLRFRFYDGEPLFEVLVTAHESSLIPAATATQLALTHASSQWFSLAREFYYTNSPSEWSTSTAAFAPNTVSASFIGGAYASTNQNVGVGPYIDTAAAITSLASHSLLDEGYTHTWGATVFTASSPRRLPGFAVTTVGGYQGALTYNRWQQRSIARVYPYKWQHRPAKNATYATQDDINDLVAGGVVFGARENESWPFWWNATKTQADWQNDWDKGIAATAWVTAQGYAPGLWMSMWTPRYCSWETGLASTAYATWTGNATGLYPGGAPNFGDPAVTGTPLGILNPFTADGRAAIEARAQFVHDLGYKYARLDICHTNPPWLAFAWAKVFSDAIKALDPDFIIESAWAFMHPFIDAIRTNDTYQWSSAEHDREKKRFKIALVHAPHRFIDCDDVGKTPPEGIAQTQSAYVAYVTQEIKMMLGYGRHSVGFHTWTPDATFDARLAGAWPTIQSLAAVWNTLPTEIPERAIVGSWDTSFDTRLDFSDGSYITWVAATDTLTQVVHPGALSFDLAGEVVTGAFVGLPTGLDVGAGGDADPLTAVGRLAGTDLPQASDAGTLLKLVPFTGSDYGQSLDTGNPRNVGAVSGADSAQGGDGGTLSTVAALLFDLAGEVLAGAVAFGPGASTGIGGDGGSLACLRLVDGVDAGVAYDVGEIIIHEVRFELPVQQLFASAAMGQIFPSSAKGAVFHSTEQSRVLQG